MKIRHATVSETIVRAGKAFTSDGITLVACNDADEPVAYLAAYAGHKGCLVIDRMAAYPMTANSFMPISPAEGLKAGRDLLVAIVAEKGDKTIRLGSQQVHSKLTQALEVLGFRRLSSGWVRPCYKTAAKHGLVLDIEKETTDNEDFRRVLYTGKHLQLVLMSLKPDEEIGAETHADNDQFFRVDGGSGRAVIGGKEHDIKNGSAFVIPAGTEHNVIAGPDGLKLYSLYGPAHHLDGTVHKTKADAEADDEHFDGQTTERS